MNLNERLKPLLTLEALRKAKVPARSRWGWLFGVTARDIAKADKRLLSSVEAAEPQPLPRWRQRNAEALEHFQKSVLDEAGPPHKMRIALDSGLHRHLVFRKPGTIQYWFEIVTWPGVLVITGDMGTWVFSRVTDMFTFFRSEHPLDHKYAINPDYWSQKLLGSAGPRGAKEFSPEAFKEIVNEGVEEFITDWVHYDLDEGDDVGEPEWTDDLRERVEAGVLFWDTTEHEAREALSGFHWQSDDGNVEFEFTDSWEYDLTDYSHQFLWALYAIVWAIKQYDEATREN